MKIALLCINIDLNKLTLKLLSLSFSFNMNRSLNGTQIKNSFFQNYSFWELIRSNAETSNFKCLSTSSISLIFQMISNHNWRERHLKSKLKSVTNTLLKRVSLEKNSFTHLSLSKLELTLHIQLLMMILNLVKRMMKCQ